MLPSESAVGKKLTQVQMSDCLSVHIEEAMENR